MSKRGVFTDDTVHADLLDIKITVPHELTQGTLNNMVDRRK